MGLPSAGTGPSPAGPQQPDLGAAESVEVASVLDRIKAQQALVVVLARAKRFEQLPAAHHRLRQLADELKRAREAEREPPDSAP